MAAWFMAACSTPVSLGNVFGDDSGKPPKTTPGSIAFEPVVGLPERLATPLAAELGTAAVERKLTVLGRDDSKAALRAKGYFTATAELSQTRITYVWDLFDAGGERKQRFEGQQIVGRVDADPWNVVDETLLRIIAQWTINEIVTTGAQRAAAAPAVTGSTPSTAMLAMSPQTTPAPAVPATMRARHPSFAVNAIKASTSDGSRTLPVAIETALRENGADVAPDPGHATHVVSGEASVAASPDGMDTVTLVWSLSDGAGHRLGSVRQQKKVPAGALASTWSGHIEDAAKAAAPSLISLALSN
ncbi:MAG: hypothetical protein H6884_05280 [Rhodobiaceae bacterium]|nr:hypothetical protein [Rhodobiaceae bacterium]